jgi:hypothetical protein
VPSVKARVKVGWVSTGITSFATATGLGAGVSSLTGTSFELRVIVNVFIKSSSEFYSTEIAVLFVSIFDSLRTDSEIIENFRSYIIPILQKSDKLSLFAHSHETFAPSF